jgi:hypothetical protein
MNPLINVSEIKFFCEMKQLIFSDETPQIFFEPIIVFGRADYCVFDNIKGNLLHHNPL